jgi:hypothetical protein
MVGNWFLETNVGRYCFVHQKRTTGCVNIKPVCEALEVVPFGMLLLLKFSILCCVTSMFLKKTLVAFSS